MRMQRAILLAAVTALCGCTLGPTSGDAQGLQRLYVLDCGEGVAGDVSRWSPGIDVGKPKAFVDTCYLIRHSKGWLLWDTGISDAVASMPDGLPPSDPAAVRWHRAKTLAGQLAQIAISPADIGQVAVSHSHPDHTGNLGLFATAVLMVQQAEYDWPQPNGAPRFPPSMQVRKLRGDFDVFGDGSVLILSTPGHTPGHQSLLVKLPRSGALVLSGDAVHFKDNWDHRRVPSINADKAMTIASMERIAGVLKSEHAQLWINHDKPLRDSLKLAPAFYD
jgi:glyoxylase-like metal-dependent hydrolase (beta-lactamase superfamily II)